MRHTVNDPDPATAAQLEGLAEVLSACREAFLRIRDDYHWTPAAGSAAGHDIAEYERLGIPDSHIVMETVCSGLQHAANKCGGLRGLIHSHEVFGTVEEPARATLEACSYAVWTIGDNPLMYDAKGRLARTYILNRLSTVKAKEDAKRLGGKGSDAYVEADRKFRALRAEIEKAFPSTTGRDLDHPITINGEVGIGLTEVVKWFLAQIVRFGGENMTPDIAEGVYGFLSNSTHPTLYAIRQRMSYIPHAGHLVSEQKVTIRHLVDLTKFAVGAIYNALSWMHLYAGWNFDDNEEFATVIRRTLPGFFHDPEAEVASNV